MKMRQPHIVPLSTQAIEILQELQNITGGQRFVFPNVRLNGRCMSENTVNMALRGLGYSKDEFTGHGFRAIARTLLDEVLEFRIEWIEHQLAHAVKDANGRAYNRTSYLKQRQEMMQAWSDYLYALKQGAEIATFKRA
jgi:integrase